ncbi:MAG: hypothetical protein ACREAA_19410 [Candidatus Polarisedimenticolia bacterium]
MRPRLSRLAIILLVLWSVLDVSTRVEALTPETESDSTNQGTTWPRQNGQLIEGAVSAGRGNAPGASWSPGKPFVVAGTTPPDPVSTALPIESSSIESPLALTCGNGVVEATELLINGNFEAGGLAGWTVSNQPGSAGTFIADTPGTTVPLSGNPTAPNPAGGAVYAVTDMSGPGTHALSQGFTIPFGASKVQLKFQMFVDDWSGVGPIFGPGGLDHTTPPNQHARVDLLAAGSPPFDTGAGVLATFYAGVDPLAPPNAYRDYSFDLTGVAVPGQSYVIRFAGVQTQFFQHVGVDNVSVITAETCDPPGLPPGLPQECRFNCTFCGDGVLNEVELLRNGDFELGVFAGWGVFNQPGGFGSFIVDTPGTTVPGSGFPTAPNPAGGGFYAVTDMTGPGAHALAQTFTVPVSASQVTLRFQMFVDDWSGSGGVVNPAGLNYTAAPNQHARVDLLTPGSPPLDTGAGVIATYYIGVDPGATPHPYTSYALDISGAVSPGGSYVIRFAGVETLSFQHVGVDNVSIVAREECDDGNNAPGDGCGAACTVEFCGDGTIDFGETCDPPGVPPGLPNECRGDCTFCGDGILDPGGDLLLNGDFEAGFASWLVADEPGSAGTFVTDAPGTTVPSSGHPTAANPGGGLLYAVTDMAGPGAHALLQTFTVPVGASQVTLAFQMFVNDWSGAGPVINPAGLTVLAGPNQHARVDLLVSGAPPLDTGAGVVATYYLSVDPGGPPNPYRSYVFDLTGVALPGGSYQIRFAGVETLSHLHVGVDNVRIVAREECDDGNNIDGDGCSSRCLDECGSGIINPREECDPPGLLPGGSDCCAAHAGAGCTDPVCADLICDANPACCIAGWSPFCAAAANLSALCVNGCSSVTKCTFECCVDSEGDGDCDKVDNCPLTFNPGGGTALFDQPVIAINDTTFAWQRPSNIHWVKGDLTLVSTYVEAGGGLGFGVTTLAAPDVPAVGTGIWWVIKPECPPGSWSTGSPAECSPPGVCPVGGRDGNLPPN